MSPKRITTVSTLALVVTLGLLGLLSVTALQATVFRWSDAQGRLWFSNMPPRHAQPPAPAPPAASEPAPAPLTPAAPPQNRTTIPLRQHGEAFVVDVLLNERLRSPFVLDTGADVTVLPVAVAHKLKVDLRNAPVQVIYTAGGQLPARRLVLASLAVGSATVRQLEVFVADRGWGPHEVGLLGMSFLRHFHLILNPAVPSLTLIPLAGSIP